MNVLIYGNERYLLNEMLHSIILDRVTVQDQMNTVFYDALVQPFSMRAVLEDADTLPFFSEHKVVVIQNAVFLTKGSNLDKGDLEALKSYLDQDFHSTTLIFTHDNDNLDTSKDLVKKLMNSATVHRVKKLEPYAFREYLKNEIKARALKLTPQAFEELVLRLDDSMMAAHRECDKLTLYQDKIDVAEIEALVSRPLDNEIFHLVNAVMDKDLKRAMSIWNDMLILNMEPLSFVGLIASQLRLMYQVSLLNAEGYHREDMINLLSAGTPTLNVGRINRMLALSKNTQPQHILEILNRLAELDQRSKIGLLDKKFGFELFLIEATH